MKKILNYVDINKLIEIYQDEIILINDNEIELYKDYEDVKEGIYYLWIYLKNDVAFITLPLGDNLKLEDINIYDSQFKKTLILLESLNQNYNMTKNNIDNYTDIVSILIENLKIK